MDRRQFLRNSAWSAAALGLSGTVGLTVPRALAANAVGNRRLLHIMLLGGADLRFLFVPEPGTPYADKFWEARQDLYQSAATTYASYADAFTDLYLPTTDASGQVVGIHREASWLAQQFAAGNVAVIANVLGSANRRHDHSQLIVHTGDVSASQYVYDRDGWGGRFVGALGDAKVVSVSKNVSVFCQGDDPADRLARVVHVVDSRNFGLSDGNADPASARSAMGRALKHYYSGKRLEAAAMQPDDWKYWRFVRHESALRSAAADLNAQLAAVAPDQPLNLRALYDSAYPDGNLSNTKFGLQCASAYDSVLASDLFGLRAISMEYNGWDTHKNEKARIEPKLADVFGLDRGLHTLMRESALTQPGSNDDTTLVFGSDFGRQLRANGDTGTDHGRGSYTILVGPRVNGGFYGEMFPDSEIAGSTPRVDVQGADIEGRTSFEHILGRVCDWVAPGSGAQVFPALGQPGLPLESGVNPAALFVSDV